uniref:Uncharacterized protein n=1 Tax=Romanomermis culicivorax TaxID=13658 RepID=A0A915JDV2_ROMCU
MQKASDHAAGQTVVGSRNTHDNRNDAPDIRYKGQSNLVHFLQIDTFDVHQNGENCQMIARANNMRSVVSLNLATVVRPFTARLTIDDIILPENARRTCPSIRCNVENHAGKENAKYLEKRIREKSILRQRRSGVYKMETLKR